MNLELFPLSSIVGASITGKYFTRLSESQSGFSTTRNYGGGYWEISVNLLRKSRQEHDQIFAFLNKHQGRFGRFLLELPYYSYSKSSYRGSIYIDGADQVGSEIMVKGMSPDTEILQAGDFIQFKDQEKVYIVTETLYSDSSGNGILKISPQILSSLIDNTEIIFNKIQWSVRNTSDEISLNLDLQIKADWSLTFRESWL